MSIESQIASIHGSMNQTNTAKHVRTDQGQVIERINLRTNSKDGNKYYNEKIKGNLLISKTLPSGTNKVIGWCNDYENDAIIYFIYNDSLRHCIYRYFINTKAIQTLWYAQSALGFEDTYIKGTVVEGNLYWINGDQQPKSFDIDKAVNGEYTVLDQPYDENIFPLIKKPPQFAPVCTYDSDVDYNFNNLRKKLFQFRYAYMYDDNQISSWSSISKAPLPMDEIGVNGEFTDDIKKNNIIKITYNTGSNRVKKILFAVRDTYLRNTGIFYKFDEVEKYDIDGNQIIYNDSEEEIIFYNNKRSESIDTTINNRYCDHVPLSGNDILLLDNKYLAIAYPKEGYDKISLDYTLTALEDEIDVDQDIINHLPTGMITGKTGQWIQGCSGNYQGNLSYIEIPTYFFQNANYNISFKVNGWTTFYFTVSTGDSDPLYPRSVRDQFLDQMRSYFDANHPLLHYYIQDKTNFFGNSTSTGIVLGFSNMSGSCPPLNIEVNELMGSVTSGLLTINPTPYKSLKKGQYHPFGIIYNDNFGRYNIVFTTNEGSELYSPLPEDDSDAELNKRVRCQWQINHRPPIEAKTYRWVYIRNKSYIYFQYFSYVKSTLGTGAGDEFEGGNGIPQDKYFLEINQSLQRIRDRLPNFIIPDYVWQNGDRIRVLGEENSYEVLSSFIWTVGDASTNGFLVDEPLCEHTDNEGYATLLEIYRPNPEPEDTVYYEIGEEFEILDAGTGNRRHASQDGYPDQSADLSVPAMGIMDFGDIYLRQRVVIDQNNAIHLPLIEDEYFNDYYISNAIDIGRVGAKIDSEQKYLNRVVRSENYLENTEYNLLNVWLPSSQADYFDASDLYGNITGIQQVGEVLKVIQEHKETSVYIGRILAKEGDGGDIALDSTRVFGTQNEYVEIRGSKYNRSIVKNNRYLYYFDESTGEFIRSSANGQSPISSYFHMTNWFEKKAKALREYTGTKDVIVSCDNDYNEVLISFIIGTEIETLVFSEEENEKGWMYFVYYKTNSTIPDNFAFQGDTLLSFMNGRLYLHNEGVNNTFYGQLHPCSVKFVINVPAGQSKRFANIRINSDKNIWDVEFTTEDFVNYGLQKSILKPTIIREMNGRLHSDILGNIIQRNGVENLSLLHNGHDLVGEVLFVELSNDDNSDVVLGDCEVKYYINK